MPDVVFRYHIRHCRFGKASVPAVPWTQRYRNGIITGTIWNGKQKQRMKKNSFLDTGIGIFLIAMLANLLWGSAPSFIKLGYRQFQIAGDDVMSQILFAGIRFTLAGILTILLGSLMERQVLKPGKGSGGMLLALALTQTVVQYVFFYMGLSKAPGYKGSVISPSSAFFAVLLATLIFRQEKLTIRKLLGCVVGFTGVVLISVQGEEAGAGFRWDGEGFLLLAALSYACSSVLIKRFSEKENPVMLSGYQFLIGGSLMTAVSFLAGGRLHPLTAEAWLMLLYLGFLSAAAYSLWALLLQRHPVSRITIYSFANPVFGVILSAWILGEGKQLDLPRCILALLLVGLGIWIVNRPINKARSTLT